MRAAGAELVQHLLAVPRLRPDHVARFGHHVQLRRFLDLLHHRLHQRGGPVPQVHVGVVGHRHQPAAHLNGGAERLFGVGQPVALHGFKTNQVERVELVVQRLQLRKPGSCPGARVELLRRGKAALRLRALAVQQLQPIEQRVTQCEHVVRRCQRQLIRPEQVVRCEQLFDALHGVDHLLEGNRHPEIRLDLPQLLEALRQQFAQPLGGQPHRVLERFRRPRFGHRQRHVRSDRIGRANALGKGQGLAGRVQVLRVVEVGVDLFGTRDEHAHPVEVGVGRTRDDRRSRRARGRRLHRHRGHRPVQRRMRWRQGRHDADAVTHGVRSIGARRRSRLDERCHRHRRQQLRVRRSRRLDLRAELR